MIKQSIKMSISSILSNKLRSFLTMLGIIIGVLTVCLVSTITTSITNVVLDELGAIVDNYCQVNFSEDIGFTEYDIIDMKNKLFFIDNACSFGGSRAEVSNGRSFSNRSIKYISDVSYQDIMDLRLECGRFFIREEIENGSALCVISYNTAVGYFQSAESAIGREISIDGTTGKIIGVIKEPSVGIMEYGDVLVPYAFFINIFPKQACYIRAVLIETNGLLTVDECVARVKSYMNNFRTETEDIFTVETAEDFLSLYDIIAAALNLLLVATSLLTMIISGTGIMNIMIVSVTNRTREIGIRKSIGATGPQIKIQFLLEAILICVTGAAVGIVLYFLLIPVLQLIISALFVSVSMSVSMTAIALATGFAVFVGVLFGYYPAQKAAKLKPVEALRYEG